MTVNGTVLPESSRKCTVALSNGAKQLSAESARGRNRGEQLELGDPGSRPERPVTERAQMGVDE